MRIIDNGGLGLESSVYRLMFYSQWETFWVSFAIYRYNVCYMTKEMTTQKKKPTKTKTNILNINT